MTVFPTLPSIHRIDPLPSLASCLYFQRRSIDVFTE
jgi:hypothetical protein